MPALMALLFVIIVTASAFEADLDALVLRLTGFALFAMLAYAVRTRLKMMSFYVRLIDAFAALFAVTVLWSVVEYMHLFNTPSAASSMAVIVILGLLNLAVAIVLIGGLLYLEKDRIATIFAKAGQLADSLKIGVPALVAGIIVSAIVAYQFYGAGQADYQKLLTMFALLAVFSVAAGVAGEAWFRGLFLSRLLSIAGKGPAMIIQAVIFAFFQAGMYYLLTSSQEYAGAVLVVSAITGLALAYLTIKNNSLITALLASIGLNMVVALPLFAVLLGA
jgi:membrane protease YdiL (CAAX protease family)